MRWPWKFRTAREQELDREIRAHLDLEAAEQREAGLSPDEAQHAPRRAFGNPAIVKEEVRSAWGSRQFDSFGQDVACALRLFRRAPGFTAVIVATLALGIGANTAVFTILNAVLLRPLPYREPGRMVAIWDREIHAKGVSKLFDLYSDYENWRRSSRNFEDFTAASWSPGASPGRVLKADGVTRNVFSLPATPDFFRFLGVPAALGRTFDEHDANGCPIVLEHSFWKDVFAGRETAIGETVRLNDQACTIVGVMPEGFAFLPPEAPVSMWVIMPRPTQPDQFGAAVFARLRPGASFSAAQAEVAAIHHRIHKDRWGRQTEPVVYPLHQEFTWLTGRNLKLSLIVMFAAVLFVLLICCVNVANLLLARAAGRGREMAIRAAIGSGRARLVRQLLTENLLLAIAGSLLGTVFALAAIHWFRIAHPVEMPPGARIELSAAVFAFTALLGVIATLVFGLAPAWNTSRVDLNLALKTLGRTASRSAGRQRFGQALILAEVMLTVVLLAGAGMMIQTLVRFTSAPLGFEPEGLLTTSISLPHSRYMQPERRVQFYSRLVSDLDRTPGIAGAAFSTVLPVSGGGSVDVMQIEGRPEPRIEDLHDTYHESVSPDYFRVMRIPLVNGRIFDPADSDKTEPVVLVNESFVQRYFPHDDPLGKRIRPAGADSRSGPWFRVIGVVGDEKRTTVYQEMAWVGAPTFYRSLNQSTESGAKLLVRVRDSNAPALRSSIERAIANIDSEIPLDEIQSVSRIEARATAYPRFRAVMLGAFAAVALLLAVVGVFGVLSHTVGQRTQEIGVRMALGAQRRSIVQMILREGLFLTGCGVALGYIAASALGRYFSALLYNFSAADPLIDLAVAVILIPAALIATYLPAHRASKVDPMTALRYE
jgi:predicted permease